MNLTAQLLGRDELAKQIAEKIAAARRGAAAGVMAGAQLMEAAAKATVRVETGNLRDHIHIEAAPDDGPIQTAAVLPADAAANKYGFDPAYARRLEYGFDGTDSLGRTYHQAPIPYMRPAFDETQDAAKAAIAAAIAAELGA